MTTRVNVDKGADALGGRPLYCILVRRRLFDWQGGVIWLMGPSIYPPSQCVCPFPWWSVFGAVLLFHSAIRFGPVRSGPDRQVSYIPVKPLLASQGTPYLDRIWAVFPWTLSPCPADHVLSFYVTPPLLECPILFTCSPEERLNPSRWLRLAKIGLLSI